MIFEGANGIINDSYFQNNTVDIEYGALYLINAQNALINSTRFYYNRAYTVAGSIHIKKCFKFKNIIL